MRILTLFLNPSRPSLPAPKNSLACSVSSSAVGSGLRRLRQEEVHTLPLAVRSTKSVDVNAASRSSYTPTLAPLGLAAGRPAEGSQERTPSMIPLPAPPRSLPPHLTIHHEHSPSAHPPPPLTL